MAINKNQDTLKMNQKEPSFSNSNLIYVEKQINFSNSDLEKDPTYFSDESWCNRSLEQLEMTISLLTETIDSDFNNLQLQKKNLDLCRRYINEIKSTFQL